MSRSCILDDYDLDAFLNLAANFNNDGFGYVVTPNVDHLIRFHDEPAFRALYADASYVLLDSRFLSHIFRVWKGLRIPVCTGSDLTAQLFARVIAPEDKIVLIGCSVEQANAMAQRYGLKGLRHYNPPMGFIDDPQQVAACLQFVEDQGPFRFCFLAVGAPQQEMLAHQLKSRGIARGLALCVGASINFLTGVERRAPRWLQLAGMEWSYRLLQNPARLARRYLVRGLRVFFLLPLIDFLVRPRALAERQRRSPSRAAFPLGTDPLVRPLAQANEQLPGDKPRCTN